MKILKAAVAVALLAVCSPAIAADPVTAPIVITNAGSLVDLAPLAGAVAHFLLVIGAVAGVYFIQKNVADKTARDTLTNALLHGVNMGFNMIPGAIAGQKLTVDVGSKVAAKALQYVLDVADDEIKKLGLTEGDLATRVVARIPNIDGEIPADMLNQIVASATGKAGAPMDLHGLLALLADHLAKERGQRTGSPPAAAA